MSAGASIRQLPECWGHRGFAAAFAENTLEGLRAAITAGADAIESDVHVTLDGVIVLSHDPNLVRITDTIGLIRDMNWHGEDGIKHCRTKKEPKQPIATFSEVIKLLMLPENRHVKFNVDVKVENDPDRLFKLMHETISSQESWETMLVPRMVLGIWHPVFIIPAQTHLSYLSLSHIGVSLEVAREYFWEACDAFSMTFWSLSSFEGERFRNDARNAGKQILVWVVNDPLEMVEAVRWNAAAIITDKTDVWVAIRERLSENPSTLHEFERGFLWKSTNYYRLFHLYFGYKKRQRLEAVAGPLLKAILPGKGIDYRIGSVV